jgi:hypothetical protein
MAGAALAAEHDGAAGLAPAPGAGLTAALASVAAFAVSAWLCCSLMLSVDTSVGGAAIDGCQEFELTIPVASFGCQPGPCASFARAARVRWLALNRSICNDEHNFAAANASRRCAMLLDCFHILEPILPV